MDVPPPDPEMSASQDPELPIVYVKPTAFPKASASSELAAKLQKAVDILHKVRKRWDPVHLDPQFTAALAIVINVSLLLAEELPGMPESDRDTRFRKPDLEEVINYAATRRISVNDAEWFFDKCTGSGWKNDGRPIIDWQATIRSWYRGGYFPSQKQSQPQYGRNTSNPPKTPLAEQSLFTALKKAKKALDDEGS